ncbi:hypothetical protein [Streptomyces sp. NPDC048438]|uniref:NucA/NucB deoxyribonuclease domain-containing protein n=1 Tax=Streptomyces sp. NPDC048438 TaxID=3365551 RepID=UPI00371E043C
MSQVSIASMLERCVPCGGEARSSSKRFTSFAVAYSVIAAWTAPAASSQATHASNATAKQEACYLALFESRGDSPAGWNADGDAKFDLCKDCDEHPFRSSAEGAARYQYEGDEFKDDFSARYINREENQEAGRRLGAWYHSDRTLDWRAFTVTIGG